MLSIRRNNPLLSALLNEHKTKDAVAGLQNQQYLSYINQSDSLSLSPLQKAAYEGMTEVVLALITRGAPININKGKPLDLSYKPPLYLSVYRGHTLITQILLCLGADLNLAIKVAKQENNDEVFEQLTTLTIDPEIFCAVVNWSISHHANYNDNHLIDLLINQINLDHLEHSISVADESKEAAEARASDPFLGMSAPKVSMSRIQYEWIRLAELAMQRQQIEKSWKMLTLVSESLLCDSSQATILYWNIIHTGGTKTSLPKKFIHLTLQQLSESGHKQLVTSYLKKLSHSDVEDYLELEDVPINDMSLARKIKKIYNAAQYNQHELYVILVNGEDKLHEKIFELALNRKNYVVMEFLKYYLSFGQMLATAIKLKDRSFILCYMFVNNKFIFELACSNPKDIPDILHLLNFRDNFILRMFSYGLANKNKDIRSAKEIAEHQAYLKLNPVSIDEFLNYYYAIFFHLYDPSLIEEKLAKLSPENRDDMSILAARFNITLHFPAVSSRFYSDFDRAFLTDKKGPAHILLQLMDEQSRGAFAQISRSAYRISLEPDVDLMNHLLTSLQNEIEQGGFFSYRDYKGAENHAWSMFWMLFSLLGLIISSIATGLIVNHRNHVKDDLQQTSYSITDNYGRTTIEQCRWYILEDDGSDAADRCDSYYKSTSNACVPLCTMLETLYKQCVGSGLGIAFSSLIILFSICAKGHTGFPKVIQALRAGNERLDDFKFSDLPLPLQQEAQSVFEKIKSIDAQSELTVQSSVREAKESIAKIKSALHTAKQNRYRFIQNNSVEIIDDEERKESIQSSSAGPSRVLGLD